MKKIYKLTCRDTKLQFYCAKEYYSNKKAAHESKRRLIELQKKKRDIPYVESLIDGSVVVSGRWVVNLQEVPLWKDPSDFF